MVFHGFAPFEVGKKIVAMASFPFVGFSLLFALLINLRADYVWRSTILLLVSLAFAGSLIGSWLAALPLIGFVLGGYAAVLAANRAHSALLGAVLVALLVASFAWLRRYSFLDAVPSLPFLYATVGMSYILFRVVHLIVDCSQAEDMPAITVVSYLNYTCNFLCFVSGPIDRYPHFDEMMRNPVPSGRQDVRDALSRIVIGYAKILIISALTGYAFDFLKPALLTAPSTPFSGMVGRYAMTAPVYAVFLYYNFSGYIDVVIGIGRLAGIVLPENFNKPFAAKNMLEFWNRWHMTLSGWFKQYLFNPLLQFFMFHFPSEAATPWLGVLAYILVFTLIGIWHGSTTVFLVYGAVLGLGVGLNKMWQVVLQKRLGHKGYRQLAKNQLYGYMGQGFTFAYFAVAVTAFWVNGSELEFLARHLGVAGLVATLAILTGARGALAFLEDLLKSRLPSFAPSSAFGRGLLQLSVASILVVSCLGVQAMLARPAEFVYARF